MRSAVQRRRTYVWWLGAVAFIMVVAALAAMPTTTRQGIDFVVTTRALPLYLKALDFVDRDLNYSALARRITAGKATDEARVLAVFDWTRTNVRDVPAGLPIVDDHIWHIIVRGYGVADQKADVFTTLSTYAGVPAYWYYLRHRDERLPVSLALVQGHWRLFDLEQGLVFRDARGGLLSVEALARDPAAIAPLVAGRTYHGRPYAAYFRGFRAPAPPTNPRPEMQMLWPRFAFEAKKRLGLGGREWDPDPGRPQAAKTAL